MKNISKILLATIMIGVVITSGCMVANSHDRYTTVTITEKFQQSESMPFVPSFYYYNYFIIYTVGCETRTDRVSVDVYASVFEGNAYTLKWGYIDDYRAIDEAYGYVEVVR